MSYDTSLGFTRNARALSYGFYGYCMLGGFTHSNEARRTCPYMNIIYNRNRRTGCPVLSISDTGLRMRKDIWDVHSGHLSVLC